MRWQRNLFVRLVRARPRIFIATAIAVVVGIWLPVSVASHSVTRWLIAWNTGAGLYVLLAAIMMIRSSSHHMRHRAQLQDDGQLALLVFVVVSAIASLAAGWGADRLGGRFGRLIVPLLGVSVVALGLITTTDLHGRPTLALGLIGAVALFIMGPYT